MENINGFDILTAEEFCTEEFSKLPIDVKGQFNALNEDADEAIYSVMRAFAEAHRKAALEAAANQAQAKEDPADYGTGTIWVDKNSILNAYPARNIK